MGSTGIRAIRAIKEASGITLARSPDTAKFKPMPQAAVDAGCIDFILPLERIGSTLLDLCA